MKDFFRRRDLKILDDHRFFTDFVPERGRIDVEGLVPALEFFARLIPFFPDVVEMVNDEEGILEISGEGNGRLIRPVRFEKRRNEDRLQPAKGALG